MYKFVITDINLSYNLSGRVRLTSTATSLTRMRPSLRKEALQLCQITDVQWKRPSLPQRNVLRGSQSGRLHTESKSTRWSQGEQQLNSTKRNLTAGRDRSGTSVTWLHQIRTILSPLGVSLNDLLHKGPDFNFLKKCGKRGR